MGSLILLLLCAISVCGIAAPFLIRGEGTQLTLLKYGLGLIGIVLFLTLMLGL